jgi:hypothetical protein
MSRLGHSFVDGGWVMFVVFAIGLVTLGTAARFALRGERQLLSFIRYGLRALLLSGVFGFTTGMIKVLHVAATFTADSGQTARIVIQGTSEAANNPAAALLFGILTCLALAIGQRRFPQPNPSAVAR